MWYMSQIHSPIFTDYLHLIDHHKVGEIEKERVFNSTDSVTNNTRKNCAARPIIVLPEADV